MKKEATNKYTERKIKRSLWYSIIDGSFYSIMLSFGESFFGAFAVFLKATSFQLGLLGSLPQFLGSLFQFFSKYLVDYTKSRKKIVLVFAFLQSLVYLPIAFIFLFGEFKIYYLLLFMCLYWIFGTMGGPAWNSWMGDLVDEKTRGRYFGRRNNIAGLTLFVSYVLAGLFINSYSTNISTQYLGFFIAFIIAMFCRIASFLFLSIQYEPKFKWNKEFDFTLIEFLKEAKNRNFGRFVLFMAFMNFALFISSPFFTPFMLKDLGYTYLDFTLMTSIALIVKFMFMPVWGRLSDKFGTKKVLALTSFLMPICPILWVFSTNYYWMIIIQAYSGFIWAGFDLAAFSFVFDTTTPQKRHICSTYYNMLNGFGIIAGGIAGAIIVNYSHFFWSDYYIVFIASFILRYIISIIFIPTLKEVRPVTHITYKNLLFKTITHAPGVGIIQNLITTKKMGKMRL